MKRTFLLLAVISIVVATACDRKRIFESYYEIGTKGWHKDSVATFKFDIVNTGPSHNVYIDIRNKGNYTYSNLWLFLNLKSPDGTMLSDTVEFLLADNTGRWTGSGIGDLFDNRILYKSNVFFPKPGKYEFQITQGMREKLLVGIQDVGVRIEKTY